MKNINYNYFMEKSYCKKTPLHKEEIINCIKTVIDPDLQIDIFSLGLIYEINIKGNDVEIVMTLTSPTCPYADMLINLTTLSISDLDNVKNIGIKLTFDPVWTPEMMTDEARWQMDII